MRLLTFKDDQKLGLDLLRCDDAPQTLQTYMHMEKVLLEEHEEVRTKKQSIVMRRKSEEM